VLLGLHPEIGYRRALAVGGGEGGQIYGVLGHRKQSSRHGSISYSSCVLKSAKE